MFFPVWALLLEGLAPVTLDGRYHAPVRLARIPAAAEGLADGTSAEEQETLLEAMDAPFAERLRPTERGYRCRHTCRAERERRTKAEVPRDLRVRRQFVQRVTWRTEALLETPNAYDRRHGLPRLIRRYRRNPLSGGQHAR